MADSDSVLSAPELIWREDGQPVSQAFDDPYFSVDNGLEESRHVFLQHNGLPQRWQHWPWSRQPAFSIVETGFGTGLNFLLTWDIWRQQPASAGWLHFTSVEKYPLTHAQLTQALALWPQLADLSARLLADYPQPLRGAHHLSWPDERISLTLWFGDVADVLPQLSGPVHAWYLDGFAPARNPEMWSDALFRHMRRLSQRHPQQYAGELPATVATFTAAGHVRRGLLGAGFQVTRVPGYGRKREMLTGAFNRRCGPELPPAFCHKPWAASRQPATASVVIIGAGLAGACTARSLAERGVKVTVIDATGIASGGSGNPQGGLYVKLAAADDAIHTGFYLAAYQYALSVMPRYLGAADEHNPHWHPCGVLQLAYDDKEAARQQKFVRANPLPEALVRAVDATSASQLSGSEQRCGGLFFPAAGWVSPVALCQHLLQHPHIQVQQQRVTRLSQSAGQWQLHTDAGIHRTEQLVLASAHDTPALLPQGYLPVKRIRGQLSYLQPQLAPALKTVLCGRSYMAPPRHGRLCLGATYNLRDDDPSIRAADHQTNLDHLEDFGPAWQQLAQQHGLTAVSGGRVGFRCTTPDYLPMVGAIPDTAAFLQTFAPLVRNARRIPPHDVPVLPGLWLNIGHGSRGLASAPLCGELLAAQICHDNLPVGMEMAEALWPGRFLLRDMIRRKVQVPEEG